MLQPERTRPKQVYLAGPMRGIKHFNHTAFGVAAERLRAEGYAVFNPAEADVSNGWDPVALDLDGSEDMPEWFSLRKALGDDLQWIAQHADAVAMLPGWEDSKGARAEYALAKAIGLEIIIIDPAGAFTLPDADKVTVVTGLGLHTVPAPDDDDAIIKKTDEAVAWARDYLGRKMAVTAEGTYPVGPNQVITTTRPDEVRIVNPVTGGEKGSKLARFDLIPTGPLKQLAEHYGRGAAKYADRNWERGYDWSLSYASLMRHATEFWDGHDYDEDGNLSIIAVAWHAFSLAEFMVTHPELDNRPSRSV